MPSDGKSLCHDNGLRKSIVLGLLISSAISAQFVVAQSNSAKELAGLWEAKRRFGPDIRGTLLIKQSSGEWHAEIAERSAPVKIDGDSISFELPDAKGKFQGKFDARRAKIVGHWIQPPMLTNGRAYTSPVTLTRDKSDTWRGDVAPLEDEFTFYLMIKPRADGSVGAFLRNPERNLGRFIRIDRVERNGDAVKYFSANSGNDQGRVLIEGTYDAEKKTMSGSFPNRGGTFHFRRVAETEASDFYPRGYPTSPYTYAPPVGLDDGWPVGSLEDVGISRDAIQKFIQMIIDTPMDSVSASEIHGVLIARHGKLVLEEYFHGEHRDKPHDTRSAAKTLASTLFGAAVKAGIAIDASTPVYKVMNGGAFPPDLEPGKKLLTVEHLLTMSPGLDCDDRDPKSKGGEEVMQEQTEQPDWYKHTLDLKMVAEVGKRTAYCGGNPHLVGGVVQRAAGRSLPVLFRDLLAEPLAIKRYYLQLSPAGDVYFGGGLFFLPRDFMKLGQLHVNGGTWNGRKILTPDFVSRSTSHLVNIDRTQRMYGYFWWLQDYPFKGRTVRAYFAGGNGGQIVMGIPELDLVIAFYGGNYADPTDKIPQNVYVPQYILPALEN